MSNEKFRDLKIGDRVFVYFHKEYTKIAECTVTNIEGNVTYPNLTTKEISIDSISVKFIRPKNHTQKENQSFYIKFDEEYSRRGEDYTGFLTIEDALEFAKYVKDAKVEGLKRDIEKYESDFKNLERSINEKN